MYKRILVATDGSALSKKAVSSAIALASALGAELIAFHVVPRYSIGFPEGYLALAPQDVAKLEKRAMLHGQTVVDKVCEAAQARGVKASALVTQSDAIAASVLAMASKRKCDLVVMASHGRKGVKRILLGSETQHVLTHGSIPTLVLR